MSHFCQVYVGLNPIHAIKNQQSQPNFLLPFVGNLREEIPRGIAYSLKEYWERLKDFLPMTAA